jgi:hypothetical protein
MTVSRPCLDSGLPTLANMIRVLATSYQQYNCQLPYGIAFVLIYKVELINKEQQKLNFAILCFQLRNFYLQYFMLTLF